MMAFHTRSKEEWRHGGVDNSTLRVQDSCDLRTKNGPCLVMFSWEIYSMNRDETLHKNNNKKFIFSRSNIQTMHHFREGQLSKPLNFRYVGPSGLFFTL